MVSIQTIKLLSAVDKNFVHVKTQSHRSMIVSSIFAELVRLLERYGGVKGSALQCYGGIELLNWRIILLAFRDIISYKLLIMSILQLS